MNYIFNASFFTIYQAPNADELINKINTYTEDFVENDKFEWGNNSSSDKIPLKWEDYMELLRPSIGLFSKEFNIRFNFTLYNPWVNLYKRGDHQEVHGHSNYLAGVFAANDGEEFSQFYFIDKDNYSIPDSLGKILNYKNAYNIRLKAGDIMFFPGYMLHGVSPHKSDIIRKTLSFNLDIMDVVTR
tara:strand:- start:47 stop:604 length:558 start_codon:yes stop_codon:yes gene_type:complete